MSNGICFLLPVVYNAGMTGKQTDHPFEDLPTIMIRHWVNELLGRNDYTQGAQASEILLGTHGLLVTFARPVVIDGQAIDTDRVLDLFELITLHQAGGA